MIGYHGGMSLDAFFRRVLFVLPFSLAACSGTTAGFGGASQANPLDAEENSVVQQLNLLRQSAGVSQVSVCTSLNVSASAHADDMRDGMYLSDVSPTTGSDVRSRACAAGYSAACGTTIPMAELVAEGYGTGAQTVDQWHTDPTAGPILVQAGFVVVGVGRSLAADNERWTLDLSSVADPSCQ